MCFKTENEEFKKKFPTDVDEIRFYADRVEDVFRQIGIDYNYTRLGIENNVREWYYNKQPVFQILRKHENWNEEAKGVVFLRDEVRTVSKANFVTDLSNLNHYVMGELARRNLWADRIWSGVLNAINGSAEKTINEDEAKTINSFGYYKEMRSGMKRSRVINAIFKEVPVNGDKKVDATLLEDNHEEGDRSYKSYNKFFAKVADDTNPLKIKRITVLSANICDYLLASNGNSWSSCHFINSDGAYRGCYKAGTLSYANDETSMVFYTLSSEYGGCEWFMQPKITRQMFFYENGNLLQSRLYPKDSSTISEDYEDYRAVVQDIMSSCLGVPNLWKKLSCSEWSDIETPDNTFHYRDYEEYPGECVMSYPLYEFVAINASGMLCKLDPKNSFQVDVEW